MPERRVVRSIDGMTTPSRIRASDADRERIAQHIQQASAEGRLTLEETEQRLGDVYAAKYVGELSGVVADLPAAPQPRRGFPLPLKVHAVLVALFSGLLIAAWFASDAPFFWPIMPMFWLGVSLIAHAGFRARRQSVPY
jgi:hypothetical protein